MELNEELKNIISKHVYDKLGILYDDFMKLDFDKQQELIKEYHKKKKGLRKDNTSLMMIGSGENAIFVRVKKGKKIMLFDGTVIKAGMTIEEYREIQDKRFNQITEEKVSVKERVLRIFKRR